MRCSEWWSRSAAPLAAHGRYDKIRVPVSGCRDITAIGHEVCASWRVRFAVEAERGGVLGSSDGFRPFARGRGVEKMEDFRPD